MSERIHDLGSAFVFLQRALPQAAEPYDSIDRSLSASQDSDKQ